MGATLLPALFGEWKDPPITEAAPSTLPRKSWAVQAAQGTDAGASKSLMTTIGIVEGEVLAYLDTHGATTLRHLTRELEWPTTMIMMAVGALVREGLARAVQHELEIIVDLWHVRPRAFASADLPVPGVWGG